MSVAYVAQQGWIQTRRCGRTFLSPPVWWASLRAAARLLCSQAWPGGSTWRGRDRDWREGKTCCLLYFLRVFLSTSVSTSSSFQIFTLRLWLSIDFSLSSLLLVRLLSWADGYRFAEFAGVPRWGYETDVKPEGIKVNVVLCWHWIEMDVKKWL